MPTVRPRVPRHLARLVLALLLLAMAAGQVSDVPGFVAVLERYDLGGSVVSWVLGLSLLLGELVGGVALLARAPGIRRSGTIVAIVVALLWSVLAVQAFARGLALDNCGCFGVHLAQPLRWWVLLEDVELVVLAIWVHRRQSDRRVADLTVGLDHGLASSTGAVARFPLT